MDETVTPSSATDMRLFVVHMCNDDRCAHQLHVHYFYMPRDATLDDVEAMLSGCDQGDADVNTASRPIEMRHWDDLDPAHYDQLHFCDDHDLLDTTLLEFMRTHWIHARTEPQT